MIQRLHLGWDDLGLAVQFARRAGGGVKKQADPRGHNSTSNDLGGKYEARIESSDVPRGSPNASTSVPATGDISVGLDSGTRYWGNQG